ncbi:MAG: Helix-turn-helix transcriptional regulator [Actinomycetota bacterium]|nr:Helix-turn-helix transcriptional regulator [Actinomycetota bacterium]
MEPSKLLQSMRGQRGLTQAELARRSGIPRTSINAYEHGARTPTSTTLMRLAEACGLAITATAPPAIDLTANATTLGQLLDLAELLPTRPRKRLEFPLLPTR